MFTILWTYDLPLRHIRQLSTTKLEAFLWETDNYRVPSFHSVCHMENHLSLPILWQDSTNKITSPNLRRAHPNSQWLCCKNHLYFDEYRTSNWTSAWHITCNSDVSDLLYVSCTWPQRWLPWTKFLQRTSKAVLSFKRMHAILLHIDCLHLDSSAYLRIWFSALLECSPSFSFLDQQTAILISFLGSTGAFSISCWWLLFHFCLDVICTGRLFTRISYIILTKIDCRIHCACVIIAIHQRCSIICSRFLRLDYWWLMSITLLAFIVRHLNCIPSISHGLISSIIFKATPVKCGGFFLQQTLLLERQYIWDLAAFCIFR